VRRGLPKPLLLCLQLSLLLGAACPKSRPAQPDGGEGAAEQVAAPAGPEAFVLTEARVKAWLSYQDRLRGVGWPVWDGGALPVFDPDKVMARATVDERARREVGLSIDEVQHIEELVSVLAGSRLRWFMAKSEVPDPATVDPQVAANDAKNMKVLEELHREQTASLAMTEERARHGDQAINLLLKYEKPLLTAWTRMINNPKDPP
jgi:hypothetical protein